MYAAQSLARDGIIITFRGVQSDILWATVYGVHTSESLMRARAAGRHAVGSVFVTDYRHAAVLLDLDGVAALTSADLICAPGAFLVSEPQLDIFVEYAKRVLARGIVRRVFTCDALALEWAEGRAELARS